MLSLMCAVLSLLLSLGVDVTSQDIDNGTTTFNTSSALLLSESDLFRKLYLLIILAYIFVDILPIITDILQSVLHMSILSIIPLIFDAIFYQSNQMPVTFFSTRLFFLLIQSCDQSNLLTFWIFYLCLCRCTH